MTRGPLAIAHQGGAAEAPSGTLYAFATAVRSGADMFELDVHATADGHLVVLHDDTVDRTTDGTGRVDALDLADIRRLDAAHWFVQGEGIVHGRPPADYPLRGAATGRIRPPDGFTAADLTVPTLAAVLDAFPGVPVNVDIKSTAPATAPYERLLADVLRDRDRTGDVIVASFSEDALAAFRRAAPEVATSATPAEATAFWQAAHGGADLVEPVAFTALQVPETFGPLTVVTPELVRLAHEQAIAVHVWTIDDEPAMHRLLDLGVDGIVTDRPSVLRRVLDARD